MTKEEAIEYLKADIKHWENTSVSTEHLEMAIKALEQPTSDDCVSRQAVIEQAKDYGSETFLIPVNSVKALPPVTPTQGTCKDCEKNKGVCLKFLKEVKDDFYCKEWEGEK